MITGKVKAIGACFRITVPLTIRGPGGESLTKEAEVDTLLDAVVALPETIVKGLGIGQKRFFRGYRRFTLAGGGQKYFATYATTVIFGEQTLTVNSLLEKKHGNPTIGLPLLRNHALTFTVARDAEIRIFPPTDLNQDDAA